MPSAAINYRNLLLVGICLPVLLTVANQWILSSGNVPTLATFATGLLFAFYALQIGVVSWAVGRYITPWPLRWIIWVWIMALVDLQLALITASNFSHAIRCLSAGVFAGQLGAIVVWGILGSGSIVWRIPSLFILLMVGWNCYELLAHIADQDVTWLQLNWNDLVIVQGVILMVLCGILRLRGYSLQVTDGKDGGESHKNRGSQPIQFGIRDVLIWTTSLAVLLGIAKAGDLLTVRFIQRSYAAGFLLLAMVALSTVAVLLVAIWASLGRGWTPLRLLVLVLASLSTGVPLALYSVHVGQPMMARNPDYRFFHWYATGYWWIGWMFLTATLLAASLTIFRTLGYRLVRIPRQRAVPPRTQSAVLQHGELIIPSHPPGQCR